MLNQIVKSAKLLVLFGLTILFVQFCICKQTNASPRIERLLLQRIYGRMMLVSSLSAHIEMHIYQPTALSGSFPYMNIAHDTKLNGELIFRRPSVFRILLKSKRGTSVSIVSNTGRDLRIRDENIRNRRMRVRHQNSISIPNHLSLLFPYDLRLPPDDILLLSEDGILDGAEVFELRAMATSWQPEILWIDKRKLCIIRIASSYPGGPGRIYADYSEFVRLKGDSEMYVYNSLIVSHENRPLWSVKLSNVEGHFISEVRKGELDFGPEKSLLESVLEGCIRDGLVPILLVIFVLLIINIVRRRGGRNSSLRGMR